MMKNIKFRLPTDMTKLTGMLFRNEGHLLPLVFNKILLAVGGRTDSSIIGGSIAIAKRLIRIKQKQGLKGLTLFLKTCSVSAQQALGGHVVQDSGAISSRISRTKRGVPRILPVLWRSRLFNEPILCRYILSIFAIYRVFLFESPVKISTITDPYSGNVKYLSDLSKYIPAFFKALRRFVKLPKDRSVEFSVTPILTKSPTTFSSRRGGPSLWSSHNTSVLRALMLMAKPENQSVHKALVELRSYYTFESRLIWDDLWNARYFDYEMKFGTPINFGGNNFNQLNEGFLVPVDPGPTIAKTFSELTRMESRVGPIPLGKLGLKQEAAGKMRVFAMVDPITQWALYPFHSFIFDRILSKIPMDGTFNQTAPLGASRLWPELYSLDLSAATDRLPISIQSQIISHIWPGFGPLWSTILIDRDYKVPKSGVVRYAVGQPMGAYSSWAMLALTHHFIVQVAAWKSCSVPVGTWFTSYAVLGDDIVIGNRSVAMAYLEIINQIGVKCGLHKSLLSPKGTALEFAKRTWTKGIDVSPISLKDMAAALVSVQNFCSFSIHHSIPMARALKILGFGYKVLGGLNKPFHLLNETVRNVILTLILPANIQDFGEFAGRSSLTQWRWDPSLGAASIDLLVSMAKDTFVSTLKGANRALKSSNFRNEYTFSETLERFNHAIEVFKLELEELLDNTQSIIVKSTLNPLDVFKSYLSLLSMRGSILGYFNDSPARAKLGVDPRNVLIWKQWSKVIHSLAKGPTVPISQDMKESSMMFLPLFLTKRLIGGSLFQRLLPTFVRRWVLMRSMKSILFTCISVIWYTFEWFWLGLGVTLTIVCIGILYDPLFITIVVIPILSSCLASYQVTTLLGALGIEYIEPVTWWSWAVGWVTYSVSFPLSLADYCVSVIIWWNTWFLATIKASTGFIGLWFFFKVAGMIKFIYASTIGVMTLSGFSGPWAGFVMFLTQAIIHCLFEPLHSLIANFSLVNFVLFICPDPLGLWNGFITINLLPWTLLREFVVGTWTQSFITILCGFTFNV